MTRLSGFVVLLVAALLAFGLSGCRFSDDESVDDVSFTGADDDVDDDVDDDDSADGGDDDTWPPLPDDDADDDVDDDADDDTGPICDWSSYDPSMEAGIAALSAYDPDAAQTAFDAAKALCPDVADATMGLMLVGLQRLTKEAPTAFETLAGFPDIDWAAFQQSIRDVLMPLNAEILDAADDLIANHPDARLFVDPMPFWVDGEYVVIDAGGEWDLADALDVAGIARFAQGIESLLVSLDLDADWTLLSGDPGGYDPVEYVHYFAGQLLLMFADPTHPDFLKFVPGGEDDFADAAIALGRGCTDLLDGLTAVLDETDPQIDDVTAFVDENGNGVWDEGEVFRIPYMGVLSERLNDVVLDAMILFEDLGPALLDSGPEDPNPLWPQWLPLDDLNFILDFFASYAPMPTLPAVPVPVGVWFYNPSPDGLRNVAQVLVQALYDVTLP